MADSFDFGNEAFLSSLEGEARVGGGGSADVFGGPRFNVLHSEDFVFSVLGGTAGFLSFEVNFLAF